MKVICKKNYYFSSKFSFIEGEYYLVLTELDNCYWIYLNEKNGILQKFGKYNIIETCPLFSEYFLSISELRKQKLSILNNLDE